MKSILIIVLLAAVCNAVSIDIPTEEVRILQITSTSITAVTDAITDAIGKVTLWKGGEVNARLELLNELRTFQGDLQACMRELNERFRNGTEYRSLLMAIEIYLQIHRDKINPLITILIPTMEDSTATNAITSSLDVIRAANSAMETVHILIASLNQ